MAGSGVHAEGLNEVVRALRRLPGDADRDLERSGRELAARLVDLTRAAGRGSGRQAARAAATVRVGGGGVTAGPHPLLYGSEFGANGRYGWYAARRYSRSAGRQFPRHLGGGSYWFFRTAEGSPAVDEETRKLGDNIISGWTA
jgi:hypothetical protein